MRLKLKQAALAAVPAVALSLFAGSASAATQFADFKWLPTTGADLDWIQSTQLQTFYKTVTQYKYVTQYLTQTVCCKVIAGKKVLYTVQVPKTVKVPYSVQVPYKAWVPGTGGTLFSTSSPVGVGVGAPDVLFKFDQGALKAFGYLPTKFEVYAKAPEGNAAFLDHGDLVQPGLSGHFEFIYWGKRKTLGKLVLNPGAVLVSADFTDGEIKGPPGSHAGQFEDLQDLGGSIKFKSAFFNFQNATDPAFDWFLSQINPGLGTQGSSSLDSFRGDASYGLFAANGVPEPGTWAMMMAGVGLMGATLRRRRMALAKA